MKIVIVASSIVPGNSLGIEHFTYRLLNALRDYYPQNEYVILIPSGTLDAWHLRVPQKSNTKFVPLRFSASARNVLGTAQNGRSDAIYSLLKKQAILRLIFRSLKQIELRRVLRNQKPDLVYCPLHVESLVFGRWKTVVSIHDLREIMPEFYDREKAKHLRANVIRSQGIVVAWQHPYKQLTEKFPSHKLKIQLIPFPIPIARSTNSSVKIDRNESEQEIILFASALREQKNHINLLRAMPEIIRARSSKNKQALLVCAGTLHYPLYEELTKETARLGIQESVTFTGFISDAELERLYESSTLVVSPTLWEAASGAVFEAFSFEKPVACSHISPIVSQVEQAHGSVNYFNPHDPQDISRSILEVLQNPFLYIEGAKRGSEFVHALSWEKTANEYMQVFRQVVD